MARRYISATGHCSWENPSKCCTESSESTTESTKASATCETRMAIPLKFEGAVFRLPVDICYIHSCTIPQAHSINACFLLPNPLVHTTYASPGSWFSKEYAPFTTCIPSSITQLSFGILFHIHCCQYPIMLTSAKPFLTTGKNTSTSLSSIGNTHPVTGTLKNVKSSVARSGGIVLRWSSGYGAGGQFLGPGFDPQSRHIFWRPLASLNLPVSSRSGPGLRLESRYTPHPLH